MASSSSVHRLAAGLIFLIVFFISPQQGYSGGNTSCSLHSIAITQTITGVSVKGSPEYKVMISNQCNCPQSNLVVKCAGFSSTEPLDITKFLPLEDSQKCLVNRGRPVVDGDAVVFKFASKTIVELDPFSSTIIC